MPKTDEEFCEMDGIFNQCKGNIQYAIHMHVQHRENASNQNFIYFECMCIAVQSINNTLNILMVENIPLSFFSLLNALNIVCILMRQLRLHTCIWKCKMHTFLFSDFIYWLVCFQARTKTHFICHRWLSCISSFHLKEFAAYRDAHVLAVSF